MLLPELHACSSFSNHCFRPPLVAGVVITPQHRPARVEARGVKDGVVAMAGSWRTTGEWARDEWDIGLDDGALYRLYREHRTNEWFIEGGCS